MKVDVSYLARFLLVFLVLVMAIGVNMPENMISRLGVNSNYLLVALVAVAITALIVHRRIVLIITVVMLAIGANIPEAYIAQFGIDRDYLIAGLVALVIAPLVYDLVT